MSKQTWKPGNMLYPVPAVMVSCRREGEKPKSRAAAGCIQRRRHVYTGAAQNVLKGRLAAERVKLWNIRECCICAQHRLEI